MRILIISTFFPPLNSIASCRPYSWAKYWTLAGHKVDVLTVSVEQDPALNLAFPNPGFEVHAVPLPKWVRRLKQAFASSHQHSHKKTGCTFFSALFANGGAFLNKLRAKTGVLSSCRMPDLTHFWVCKALKQIKENAPWDLVVSTAGPYPVHILASKLKEGGKAVIWIADYRDRWSDSCIYPGLKPFSLIEKAYEKRLLKKADLITTVSEPFRQHYAIKYGEQKAHLVENGMDPEDLETLDPTPIFPQDGKYRIAYTGTLYLGKRVPSALFDSVAAMSRDPELLPLLERFEMVFAGPNPANLQELIDTYQVQRWTKVAGVVNRRDALRMQRDAHALLFIPWDDPENDGNLTGKLFEYLYARTPILAIGAKQLDVAQRLIIEAQAGVILASQVQVMDYLKRQLQQPKKVTRQIDPALLQRYDRRVLAHKLLNLATEKQSRGF
jgi:glycosyltransferase involved in cell wall biosynthesis